jgi:peptidoglycan/xylan/chitin deacetylase (PgdA/CDA1 family)
MASIKAMPNKERYILVTNDVETTSIINNKLSESAGNKVLHQGMPRLLDLYAKYDIKTTFFYCGDIIRQHPQTVVLAHENGHEIGSHGWSHEDNEAFDVLSLDEQIEHIMKSKSELERIIQSEVLSFRAPALRINDDTCIALHACGIKVDSSISPQRIDMLLSFGVRKKMRWITANRNPYFVSSNSLFKKGESNLLEIPVSAAGFGYIGTTLRVSPGLARITRYILHLEAMLTGRPIVFLTHPNEFIDETFDAGKLPKRGNNFISYLLGDKLRRQLKLRNLGKKGIPLLEREIAFFKKKGYQFITCREYYQLTLNRHNNAIK